MSTMLMMPPGSLATTDDLVELCKVKRSTADLLVAHPQQGTGVFDSVKK